MTNSEQKNKNKEQTKGRLTNPSISIASGLQQQPQLLDTGTKALFTNCLLYASKENFCIGLEIIYLLLLLPGNISILGPLLFLIFINININDIVKDINSNIRLFRDNTILYIIVDSPDTSASLLNSDLNRIHLWSKTWLITFNPTKTEAGLFSKKKQSK